MSDISAIQGVDDILRKIVTDAVASLDPKPEITVGPLDHEAEGLRLNWFLYRIAPDRAYRNMEPPRLGWRTTRGSPPLALRLSYLLSAHPAKGGDVTGDQDQFAHDALTAAMRALHENAIVGEGSPILTPALDALVEPLIEPLRIVMADLDLESLAKLWTAAIQPLRLSAGYEVSVVIVAPTKAAAVGPPVAARRVAVVPSLGPRFVAVNPGRASYGDPIDAEMTGLTSGSTFSLQREHGEGRQDDWQMVASNLAAGHVRLQLPDPSIAPGLRALAVSAVEMGLPFGRDVTGLTVVPTVTGAATPLARGARVALDTAHAAPDVEVFLRGVRVDDAAYVSPTQVALTIPSTAPSGPADVVLRAGKVAGPVRKVTIA